MRFYTVSPGFPHFLKNFRMIEEDIGNKRYFHCIHIMPGSVFLFFLVVSLPSYHPAHLVLNHSGQEIIASNSKIEDDPCRCALSICKAPWPLFPAAAAVRSAPENENGSGACSQLSRHCNIQYPVHLHDTHCSQDDDIQSITSSCHSPTCRQLHIMQRQTCFPKLMVKGMPTCPEVSALRF